MLAYSYLFFSFQSHQYLVPFLFLFLSSIAVSIAFRFALLYPTLIKSIHMVLIPTPRNWVCGGLFPLTDPAQTLSESTLTISDEQQCTVLHCIVYFVFAKNKKTTNYLSKTDV